MRPFDLLGAGYCNGQVGLEGYLLNRLLDISSEHQVVRLKHTTQVGHIEESKEPRKI